MAIGDDDFSDNENMTDIFGVSGYSSEDDSDSGSTDGQNNFVWTDTISEDAHYDHPQFTGGIKGPLKLVTTFLQCFELYLTPAVVNLIVVETNRLASGNLVLI
jgi:hypothetical protein